MWIRASFINCASFAAALAVVTATSPCRADGEEDSKTLFAQGRSLRDAGDCAAASVAFRKAWVAWPAGLGSLRNLAECQTELAQFASARRSWFDLARAVKLSGDPKYDGWVEHAEAKYVELHAKVPRVVIRLEGAATAEVRVVIDGQAVAPELVGTELERDVGSHQIEAFVGDTALTRQTVTLTEGARETAVLVIAIPEAAPPPQPPPGDDTVATPTSGLAIGGYVALGIGVLGAAGTVVAIVVREGALSDLAGECEDYASGATCPQTVTEFVDRGETASLLVNVFAAVGIAGVGVGAALLIADALGDDATEAGVRIVPLRDGAFIGLERRF
jgi:hypothetical protein